MRHRLVALALPILAALSAPAYAQEKVTRLDYGFSYVIPRNYKPDPTPDTASLGDIPISLVIKDGTDTRTLSSGSRGYTNLSILSSIDLIILNTEKIITITDAAGKTEPDKISERDARRIVELLNLALKGSGTTLNFEKSATIKIDGVDAAVVRCNGFDEELDSLFTARLIFLIHKTKLYLFTFGSLNDEFEEKVGAFNNFMNSFKFLKPPGAATPKKPKAKK